MLRNALAISAASAFAALRPGPTLPPMPGPAALIDPDGLTLPWAGATQPYGLVDLDRAPRSDAPLHLPPFPLLGIGDPTHPLAPRLDALVELPVSLGAITQQIMAQPEAARVLVQLLRLIDGLDPAQALVAESLAYGVLQGSAGHARWLAAQVPAPVQAPGTIGVDRDGDRLSILIDRPGAHNAIDRDLRDGLRAAFDIAALDPDISHVSLRGAGRSFCTGADLSEFGTTRDSATAHDIRMQTLPAYALLRCADRLTVHVQGGCVGSGLEMAAFAGQITASADAWFHLPELAMGIIPGAGGCVSLSRRIGRQRAALMILSGKRINARTALGWGLVDTIMDD